MQPSCLQLPMRAPAARPGESAEPTGKAAIPADAGEWPAIHQVQE
jgi:hypothetical protein